MFESDNFVKRCLLYTRELNFDIQDLIIKFKKEKANSLNSPTIFCIGLMRQYQYENGQNYCIHRKTYAAMQPQNNLL